MVLGHGVRRDYCLPLLEWICSQNSFFMILKERKEEMATVASIPNMKRRISLSLRTTYLLFDLFTGLVTLIELIQT